MWQKLAIIPLLFLLACGESAPSETPPAEEDPSLVANPPAEGSGSAETAGAEDDGADSGSEGTAGTGGENNGAGGEGGGGDGGAEEIKFITKTFEPSDEVILNPERGSVGWIGTSEIKNSSKSLSFITDAGQTLAYADAQLDKFDADAFRNAPLSQAFIDTLTNFFARARKAGIKLVLRFSYGDVAQDAPLFRIEQHISQLKPLLTANADVIYVLQAGFIGYWGEWHHTYNGTKNDVNNLDNDVARAAVIDALFSALSETRMIQLRKPQFKSAYTGISSRIGHHNDCFLASSTDYGTYPSNNIEFWKDYIANDGLKVPVGGETCAINPPKTDCQNAMDEMKRLHWSFIRESSNAVVTNWKTLNCWQDMMKNIGYRFVLNEASWNETVRPGENVTLKIKLTNEGFAPIYNDRPVYAVLSDGTNDYSVKLPTDPRDLMPGETVVLETNFNLPADLPAGEYTLSLWLPDPLLQDDPRYSIQFANKDVWNAEAGFNVLSTSFFIK